MYIFHVTLFWLVLAVFKLIRYPKIGLPQGLKGGKYSLIKGANDEHHAKVGNPGNQYLTMLRR